MKAQHISGDIWEYKGYKIRLSYSPGYESTVSVEVAGVPLEDGLRDTFYAVKAAEEYIDSRTE
jgi:hypothetical protein